MNVKLLVTDAQHEQLNARDISPMSCTSCEANITTPLGMDRNTIRVRVRKRDVFTFEVLPSTEAAT